MNLFNLKMKIKLFKIISLIMNLSFPSEYLAQEKPITIVKKYSDLRVEGNKILNQKGEPVSLRGMSLFWSQWMGKYYNYECIKWLRDNWKCTVIRAAMGIEMGGYLDNPQNELSKKN